MEGRDIHIEEGMDMKERLEVDREQEVLPPDPQAVLVGSKRRAEDNNVAGEGSMARRQREGNA